MKAFNITLINRLLLRCRNMDSLLYAYNNTKGVQAISRATMYRKLKRNNIIPNFIRGSKKYKIRSTVLDRVMSGISIDRRLDASIKPAVRIALGNCCCWCGNPRGLEIDHIDNNRYNTQIGNLQLLCGTCHNEKHEN